MTPKPATTADIAPRRTARSRARVLLPTRLGTKVVKVLVASAFLLVFGLNGQIVDARLSSAGNGQRPPSTNPNPVSTRNQNRIHGIDAHDGTIVQVGAEFFLFGTQYGCGFMWGQSSPFCGFGVWQSSDRTRWTFVRQLFSPTEIDTWNGLTWQQVCGDSGKGCFNPRMLRRTHDGVWILAFNAPADLSERRTNAYYFMGCRSVTGPCGPYTETGPAGSLTKPEFQYCRGDGDFSVFVDAEGSPWMVCTQPDQTISLEALNPWWTGGSDLGVNHVGGATDAEAPGMMFQHGEYVLTFSSPSCGYCAFGTTYWTGATELLGNWKTPGLLSGISCDGQPRTIVSLNQQALQWIDLWTFEPNETHADIVLAPLILADQDHLYMPTCPQ